MKLKLALVFLLSLSVVGCDAAVKQDLPRDHVKIIDVLTKNKEKQEYINKINPKEEYAVGMVVAQTPLKEREQLKEKTVGELISIYEKQTGEKVPSGEIPVGKLRYKELIIKSANNLYVTSYSEADREMMRNYIAKKLFKAKEMESIRNETVDKIMEDARKEK